MTKGIALAVAILAASSASAQSTTPAPTTPPAAPAAAAPVDPIGNFDFATNVEGMGPVTGTITVAKAESGTGYTGSLATTATETVPVRDVKVEGQKMTVTAETPDGPVVFILEFKGDDFTGTWSYAGMTGNHTGKRRKA